MTTVEIFGVRVRQARVLRRMTGKAVMDQMGWRGARQTRLEQSEITALDAADATRLATVLRFPVEFFATQPVSRVEPSDLLFRAPKSTTLAEREYLAQFAAGAGDLLETLNARWQLPPVKLPILERSTDVAQAARQVRELLGVALDAPIRHLMYDVERCGVPVVLRPRRSKSTGELAWSVPEEPKEKHLGYSTRVGEFRDRPLVVVRAIDSWERTRWTVAHEIGHLVLHSGGVQDDGQEQQASRFASELLAPTAAVSDEVPAVPSLMNLVPIKMRWGISIGALVRHMHESGLIDPHRYEMLQRQLYTRINPQTGHTWGRTEPGWNERVPERPRLIAKWVERCFNASTVAMLAPQGLIWPQDLLEDFLAGQRSAPSAASVPRERSQAAPTEDDNVVEFGRFRHKRQA